jgi:hypothetical protein
MSGGDAVCADARRLVHQMVKLHVVVAKDAWARRLSAEIGIHKRTNDCIFEILFKIEDIVGNTQQGRYTSCVPEIVE